MTISLTVPNEPRAIAAAAAFFAALSGGQLATAASLAVLQSAPELEDEEQEGGNSAGVATDTGSAKRDTKGVPFDANFCANATDPYYSSGARAGQWKKRKGVADEVYDAWYDERLQDLAPAGTVSTSEDDHVGGVANAGAAFGAGAAQAAAPAGKPVPQTAGEFMAWVSEKQAAGVLTQPNIQAAYQFAGLAIADLFGQDAAVVARNVSSLYQILVQTAGA